MHFRVDTFEIESINFPHFQYYEGLYLKYDELEKLENLLRKIKHQLYDYFFNLAQDNTELLNKYKAVGST